MGMCNGDLGFSFFPSFLFPNLFLFLLLGMINQKQKSNRNYAEMKKETKNKKLKIKILKYKSLETKTTKYQMKKRR